MSADCCAGGSEGPFDLAVVGGGSAAFAAARRAADLGARVLLVNDGLIGGTCVNVGCIPSKTLIRAAENHHQHGAARFRGLRAPGGTADFGELVREKDELVTALRTEKYVDVLATLEGVELVEGRARLASATAIEVGSETYEVGRIVIATGSRPSRPAIPGLEDPHIWDSTRALEAKELPRRLVVLGGRYVALELGQLFSRLGSQVTLVQRSGQILPDEDEDLSGALAGYLGEEGMEILTGAQLQGVTRRDERFLVEIDRGGRRESLETEAVLLALGRTPNTDDLGLAAVGVALEPDGAVAVGERLETSVPGIYAAGDVIGEPAYVYSAAYEGGLAAENALSEDGAKPRDYTAIPWVIFSDPQVAGVGLNELQAAAEGVEVDVSILPLSLVPRALAARDTRGFIKLLRARGEDRLVGARILAPEGGEQVMEASLAIKFGLPVSELARHFHPYLTQGEGVKLAALGFDRDVETLSCCAS